MNRWTLELLPHREQQWANPWEPERLDSMHANLRPGMVVYDIGAEEGDLPALWASWGCDTVLVEPGRRVWPNMRATFAANDLPDPVAAFVGFCDRSTHFVRDRPCLGWPTQASGPICEDHQFPAVGERPDIGKVTIDDLAEFCGRPPDAITIDVEGAEYRVLQGARGVLARHRPIVWASIHTDAGWMDLRYPGQGIGTVRQLMETELGYRPEHLATDHEEHWVFWP